MSFIKTHIYCPNCKGSDPASLNEDGSAYCFSCNSYIKDYEKATEGEVFMAQQKSINITQSLPDIIDTSSGEFNPLTDRGISLETAKFFGVKSLKNINGKICRHMYPYYVANEVAGYKVREPDKIFSWKGTSIGTGLFGQNLFAEGAAKRITITEGECDAMASYEMQGSKWPVVSLKNGAAGAERDVKNSLEFLEKYQEVVINFDNDQPGREAARKVARLLSPGKAKILTMPEEFKDANDMLKKGMRQKYMEAWWGAKLYTPSGVVRASDCFDSWMNREKKDSIPFPWEGLNKKLYGIRQGELLTVTGGTGLGKSSVVRELEHWLLTTTKDNLGIIALEENQNRTLDGIMSIEANDRIYIDHIREKYDYDYLSAIWKKINGDGNDGRVWVYSHLGVQDIEEIYSKIRFMIIGCDCKWIVLDHLHMLVSAYTEGDERRIIDSIMHRLRSIVEETGAGMILVSHLRRTEGNRGHENGITVSLSHLRGSQSIAQLSDCVIALERNQQSDDPEEANTTTMRVLKSRYTGDVGKATNLHYNNETGRLNEMFDDEFDEEVGDLL